MHALEWLCSVWLAVGFLMWREHRREVRAARGETHRRRSLSDWLLLIALLRR